MNQNSSIRKIEIVQQIKYGFTAAKIQIFLDYFKSVQDYMWILHDKDEKNNLELKEPHIHLYLNFKGPVPIKNILNACLKCFGTNKAIDDKGNDIELPVIRFNHLEKIKGQFPGAVACYCIHRNNPEKYQYLLSDIHSSYAPSELEKTIDLSTKPEILLKDIAHKIDNGIIRRYNIDEYLTIQEYARFKKSIESYFEYRNLKLSKKVDRKLEVYYFTGSAGTGKTTYAKLYCQEQNLSVFMSPSGSDILDGYLGQDVIILDDIRPGNFDSVEMLLKLTDNDTNSSVRSRFRNKSIYESQIIFFTSVLTPREFFSILRSRSGTGSSNNETSQQFFRRLSNVFEFVDDMINVYSVSSDYRRLTKETSFENPVLKMFPKKNRSQKFLEFPGAVAPVPDSVPDPSSEDWILLEDLEG